MNIKHTIKKTAAALLALALTVGATGCDFLVTDNEKDLKQTVATVNISSNLKSAEMECADDVQKLIDNKGLSTDIPKRDLIAYFLSTGYMYVQSYGYTYEDTFNMLMDGLVEKKILTQYAVAYFLEKDDALTADACLAFVNGQIDAASGKEKDLLSANREVLTMKYFLTDEEYDEAVYSLKKSLNDSLDSAETSYITETTDEHTHDETRTTPTNANVEKEDHIPMKDGALDYDIYTGRNALDSCGVYEKVDGSTVTSRKKAYNAFLSNLQGYGLIKEGEDTAVVTELDYYYLELSSTLGSALVNKYTEELKEEAINKLDATYVAAKYDEIKTSQKTAYENKPTDFDTALDSVSDTSFLLYGQKDFGFVYNILIPFSASQTQAYSAAKSNLKGDALYNARKEILKGVEAKDLRSAWFCTEEDEHYAYEATGTAYYNNNGEQKDYLFFENNMTNTDKYEKLTQYAGQYPYNGKAELVDDEWDFTPNKMKIGTATESGFIQEMEAYINHVVGGEVASGDWLDGYNESVYTDSVTKKVDYSKFMYYAGKVELDNKSRSDFFNPKVGTTETVNDSYQALSAVNELMFAYSTDTGCLNSYMGYVVSPYKTDFVSEFEYAAQAVVAGVDWNKDGTKDFEGGVGSYVVAPSDYGWHIIYCSFVYDADDGDVYGGFKADEMEVEGTFSYLFYESLKSTSASSYTSTVQNQLLNQYNNDNAVTLHTKAYQDLLELDE